LALYITDSLAEVKSELLSIISIRKLSCILPISFRWRTTCNWLALLVHGTAAINPSINTHLYTVPSCVEKQDTIFLSISSPKL